MRYGPPARPRPYWPRTSAGPYRRSRRSRGAIRTWRRCSGGSPSTGLDLILVEGFKHAAYPKIEVYRAAHGRPPLYPDDSDILAVATDAPLPEGASPKFLPIDGPDVVAGFILGCLDQGLLR